jgi:hypothetical protein
VMKRLAEQEGLGERSRGRVGGVVALAAVVGAVAGAVADATMRAQANAKPEVSDGSGEYYFLDRPLPIKP